ncbi:MAG: cyclic nucleotide-binding domain-containing protein [Gaiellaceae bacterium]
MLRRNQKVELLKKVPLFALCTNRELAEIATLADEVDLRAGKELIREGGRGREFFVLLEGRADVTKDGHRINRMGAGEFFGEIALVARSPIRTATVTATTPVRVLVVTAQNFRRLLERSPEIKLKVLEALAERIGPAGV